MATADELRAQLRVAELEEELASAKEGDAVTAELKAELRYARWVGRRGPAKQKAFLAGDAVTPEELEAAGLEPGDDPAGHVNRATADLYARWMSEQEA